MIPLADLVPNNAGVSNHSSSMSAADWVMIFASPYNSFSVSVEAN